MKCHECGEPLYYSGGCMGEWEHLGNGECRKERGEGMRSEIRKEDCDNCFKETPCLCIKECQGDSWYSDDETVLCEQCIGKMFNEFYSKGSEKDE